MQWLVRPFVLSLYIFFISCLVEFQQCSNVLNKTLTDNPFGEHDRHETNLSVFPYFKDYAFFNKSIIIAYLHLSLIGVISFFLLSFFLELKWLQTNRFVKAGSLLLISGFIITEVLLVLSGTGLFYNQIMLITGSAAMAVGIFLMVIGKASHLRTS